MGFVYVLAVMLRGLLKVPRPSTCRVLAAIPSGLGLVMVARALFVQGDEEGRAAGMLAVTGFGFLLMSSGAWLLLWLLTRSEPVPTEQEVGLNRS